MSHAQRNKKRLPLISGDVVFRTEPSDVPCPSGKTKHRSGASVPETVGSGLPLRPYLCDLCGWWHGTSKGQLNSSSGMRTDESHLKGPY